VGLQPSRHVTGAATQIAGMVLAATVAILYIPVASQVFPVWAAVAGVAVVVVAAVWGAVEGALMIVRWRRPEPFPFSDPLDLFASAG
jgi:membrane protein YdbS with pleckstrin-like domain